MIRHHLRLDDVGHRVPAPAERGRVGVEHDVICTHRRRAQPIRVARHRREVEQHHRMHGPIVPRVRQHRLLLVGHVDPTEARGLVVAPPEAGMLTVQGAERFHERHQPLPTGVAHQVPLETDVVIPLMMRRELRAHEEQRLTWARDRVADERAQIGETLPHIAGHFLQQRLLEVHDFIVRQRIHESFAVLVHHGERELVVRSLSEERIDLEVVERVVHPPHVPLQREAQSSLADGVRDPRPRRALLGHRDDAGV